MTSTFAGLSLRRDDGTPGYGAAFVLRDPASASRTATHGDWVIDVVGGTKIVMARGSAGGGYERAVADALTEANIGLDLMCVRDSERLLIDKYDEEHLAWWPDPTGSGLVVAATAVHVLEASGDPVTVQALDSAGNPVPSTPEPPATWHDSYRYFRVSQTTTNLHDAYRNAFLALESLLDHITPQGNEGEGQWFRRAMRAADRRISLAGQLAPGASDPVDAICREFYTQWRTAVAHSKASRTFILPHDDVSRTAMIKSLNRLGRYYLALAEDVLGTRRWGVYATKHAFALMAAALDEFTVYVSDDDSPPAKSASTPNPAGGSLVEMTAVRVPSVSEPFFAEEIWTIEASHLASLARVRRIVGAKDGAPGFVTVLDADLVLATDDQLQARLAFRGVNKSDLRTRYSS